MLINGTNSGWLNARYYHVRKSKRKQENFEMLCANGPVESLLQTSGVDEDMEDDVHLLKTIIVNAENLDTIKQLLNKTREYRAQMLQKNETEIKEHFPYFFSHPLELVRPF